MPGTVLGTGEHAENKKDMFMLSQSLQWCSAYTTQRLGSAGD